MQTPSPNPVDLGLGSTSIPPPPSTPRRGRGRVLWLALLIVFCALGVIGIVSYVGWHIGPVALGVGITGAILPVPILVGCFLWLDRYDPSPLWIMVVCFLWGAGVATSGALLVNTVASNLFDQWGVADSLVAVLVAPFIEESLKAAFPLLLFVFYRKAFTGVIDGIVYCGLSATGFAMVENILYLGGHGFAGESQKGFAASAFMVTVTFILRVPFSGFAHPLFTSMTGIGLGIASRSPSRTVRVLAPLAGLLTAMMLHASWNLMPTLAQSQPMVLLYGYFGIFVPIFLGMVGFVLGVRSWEGRLAVRTLPPYAAAGWFSPPEIAALGTIGRRLSARSWATRVAGAEGGKAMRAYQVAATRLALVRDGLDRGLCRSPADYANAVASERALLDSINGLRTQFVGRDPVTPRAWWSDGGYRIQFPDGVVRAVAEPALPVVPIPIPLAAIPLAPVMPPPGTPYR